MEYYSWVSWLIVIAAIVAVIAALVARRSSPERAREKHPYTYARRDYIMTAHEATLFRRLETIVRGRYYVFPQVHLSSLLDHRVKGQDWRAALSTIQRKSVDFVLVDMTSLKTAYVVELDDTTHDQSDRQQRDEMVAPLLLDADMPLVRLRDIDRLSDEDIENAFRDAHARNEQTVAR